MKKQSVKKKTAPKKAVKKATKKVAKKASSKKITKKLAPKKVVKKASPKKTISKKIASRKKIVKKVVTTTTVTTTSLNPSETHYLLILDESGSMGSVRETTFNGLNEQIQTIKTLGEKYPDQEYFVNITKFSDNVNPLLENVKSADVNLLTQDQYSPNGMTALLDAIGTSVNKLKNNIQEKINSGEASALVVILTDGDENISREYNAEKIKNLITELEKTGLWTFTFIGANQDSILTAKNLGVNVANTINYTSSAIGTKLAFATAGASLSRRAVYMDSGLYSATQDNLISAVTQGLTNIGEDENLLDLSGNVTAEELKNASKMLKDQDKKNKK